MTMLTTLSCPHGSVSFRNDFNGKLKISLRSKHRSSSDVTFPRSRVPVRSSNKSPNSTGIGWSSGMGGQLNLTILSVRGRPQVFESATWFCYSRADPRLCARWSRVSARSDMFTTPFDNNSWLGRLLKLDKARGDEDSQNTAVVDVHFRFSLSEPKSFADSVSRLAPRWFKLLKGVQPLLPLPLQSGGGGNKDGDFYSRLGYGGDDDSDNRKGSRQSKKKLLFYQWWALCVVSASILVWALGAYSGIPQRTKFPVSQFVDCVLWLGLIWCLAAFFFWTARMVVSLISTSQSDSNGWKLLRSKNAFTSGREFVLNSKVDEWIAQNVVAVPGLVISLFLVCDLIHYGKNIYLASKIGSEMSRLFEVITSRVQGEAPEVGSMFPKRASTAKKWRRGSTSKRRRP